MALYLLAAGVIVAAFAIVVLEVSRQRSSEAIARAAASAKVSVLLSEGLASDQSMRDVLQAVVPLLADWAAIHLADDDRHVRRAAVLHHDSRREREVNAYFESTPFDPGAPHGPALVIRTGAPEVVDPFLGQIIDSQPEPVKRLVADLGMESMIVVPLRARQTAVGALTLVRGRRRRRFSQIDLDHAQDIGHRIALSVENGRLFAQARQLFEQTLTANFVSTPDGRLLACNESFAQLLGCQTSEEALSQPVQSFYCEAVDRDRVISLLRQKRRIEAYEGRLLRRDGRVVPIVETAVGTFDDRNELVKITGFIVDKTTQKDLEEQLRQSQRLEAIGQLAGGIAHDFNNLLTVIIGCVDLLHADRAAHAMPAHDDHDPLVEIGKAARRAAALTQQLLAFSRRQILQPRTIDLNDALRSVHSMLRRVVRENIVLVLQLDSSLDRVRVDPGQLDQVIINLVVNASDAIPASGTITLSTRNARVDEHNPPPHVYVAHGAYVSLEVRDTGVGMDETTRARVFEPFFTTKPVGKGTGLGLSTVYGIVKQSGGYIWVTSEPGAGTAVTVYLPASPRGPAA